MAFLTNSSAQFSSIYRKYIFLMCLLPMLVSLLFVIRYAYNIPIWDQWLFIPILQKIYTHKSISFDELASQHNEHRILFPRLIMIALAVITHWNTKYEIYVGFILLFSLFLLIFNRVINFFAYDSVANSIRSSIPFVCLVVSILVFSTNQYQNLLWGWQIQIFLNILATAFGILFLTRNAQVSYYDMLLAIVFGIIASYSFANGLLFWVIGMLILCVRKKDIPNFGLIFSSWLVSSIAVIYLYTHNFERVSEHTPYSFAVYNPGKFIHYLLAYIGSPILQAKVASFVPASVGGIIGIVAVIVGVYGLIKLKLLWNYKILFWHGLMMYAVMSGFITAIGRCSFGISQALSSRYITITNFFWLWVIVILTFLIMRFKLLNNLYYNILCVLFIVVFASYDVANFKQQHDVLYPRNIMAQRALERNDLNAELVTYFNPKLATFKESNDFLRKYNLTFYYKQK